MKLRTLGSITPAVIILLIAILACNAPRPQAGEAVTPTVIPPTTAVTTITATNAIESTAALVGEESTIVDVTSTPPVDHAVKPAALAVAGKTIYDVESEGTAPEKRAPYGDSYDINRFERPFLQDMTYVPNLDLSTYMVGMDADWVYVSMALVGNDPNDKLGIDYAVELDTDHDGFGDYVLWAQPPYPIEWDTAPVKIYQDSNHNTGGLSAEKSDAPLQGDGYDKLIFNGGAGDADPDMAWVRANNGMQGLVQFAFKRAWIGNIFMLGVIADAGFKNPGQLDYVDRMKAADAGSPVRDNQYYPLKALYGVDNICRSAYGFKPTGEEPQLCPMAEAAPPHRTPKPGITPSACQPPAGGCGLHYYWVGEPYCTCFEELY